MFAGRKENREGDDVVYLAVNAYWEPVELELPKLPGVMQWRIAVNTAAEGSACFTKDRNRQMVIEEKLRLEPRSVVILLAE